MTHSEAVEVVKNWTGLPLLESLEQLKDDDLDLVPTNVEQGYLQLMAGFSALLAPA